MRYVFSTSSFALASDAKKKLAKRKNKKEVQLIFTLVKFTFQLECLKHHLNGFNQKEKGIFGVYRLLVLILVFSLSACANRPQPSLVGEENQPTAQESLEPPSPSAHLYKVTRVKDLESQEDEVIGSEVEETIGDRKLSEVPLPEVPMVLNQQVEKWMNYFQGRGRKYFASWLARSGRYVPMMRKILRENGLPEGLIYLSMIESGFRPYAYSRARAVGPWQFMKFTGARYGLRANYWLDERRDPEKSTIAAAQHLKDLYDEFDHWYLAAAGYNAGAGKISRAIKRYKSEDFWYLTRYRYLKPETKNYVPKLIAASLIASEPEEYGFVDIDYQEPIKYEKVTVPKPVTLKNIAKGLGVEESALKDLNPELRRGVTPPNYPNYELKVPVGYQEKFAEVYPNLPRYKATDVLVHRVRRGDTLSQIARRHGVSTTTLVQFNRLKSRHFLRAGQRLLIPIPGGRTKPKVVAVAKHRSIEPIGSNIYVVRRGDTLWKISRRFNVTVSQLRSWNKLSRSAIFPGQKLRIAQKKKTDTNA